MKIRFLSLANREVVDAVEWYERKEEGLSLSFLDDLDRVVRLIRRHPHAGSQVDEEIRRFFLPRFPFSLVYGIVDETIVVIAGSSSASASRVLGRPSRGHALRMATSDGYR